MSHVPGIPTDPEERREYMRMIGRKGGQSRSPKKLAAIRINARKGGRSCLPGTIRSVDNPPVNGVRDWRKPKS